MSVLVQKDSCYTARTMTARKDHRCDDYPRCPDGIKAGEPYLSCTSFPGHDSGYASYAGRPLRHRFCRRSSFYLRAVESAQQEVNRHSATAMRATGDPLAVSMMDAIDAAPVSDKRKGELLVVGAKAYAAIKQFEAGRSKS